MNFQKFSSYRVLIGTIKQFCSFGTKLYRCLKKVKTIKNGNLVILNLHFISRIVFENSGSKESQTWIYYTYFFRSSSEKYSSHALDPLKLSVLFVAVDLFFSFNFIATEIDFLSPFFLLKPRNWMT